MIEQSTSLCRTFDSDNVKKYSSSSVHYLFIRHHRVLTHKGRSDGVPAILGLHVTENDAQLLRVYSVPRVQHSTRHTFQPHHGQPAQFNPSHATAPI
jgi:hypothetical protein